jgi:DNA modification methylase
VILDPFMGSGTTAIAAINENRNYIGFELSKEYCDLANERVAESEVQNGTR